MGIHVWSKNVALLNAPEPRLRPLGKVRRRKSNASLVSDFISLRKTLFLCGSCERRMPLFWKRRYGYWRLPSFHGENTRCDGCQDLTSGDLFLAEEGGYAQEHFRNERTRANARDQQIAVREGRRIKGT